jgi:hypothetical protein
MGLSLAANTQLGRNFRSQAVWQEREIPLLANFGLC